MATKELLPFVIKRSIWLRGEGNHRSYLLRPQDGKMCCLGQFAEHVCGLHPDDLRGHTSFGDLDKPTPIAARRLVSSGRKNSDIAIRMMRLNDDESIDDAEREREDRKSVV